MQLVESELVAENSRSRCKEQGIPFFRFSPKFDELIATGETDNEKLFNLVIKTKVDLKHKEKEFDELVNLFLVVAESSKDLDQDAGREDREEDAKPQLSKSIQEEKEEEEEPATQEVVNQKEEEPEQQEVVKREEELGTQEDSVEEKDPVKPSTMTVNDEDLEDKDAIKPSTIEDDSPQDDSPVQVKSERNIPSEDIEEEDETICSLIEGIKEENESCLPSAQAAFSENFLFNSISDALTSKDRENLDFLKESRYNSFSSPHSTSPDNDNKARKVSAPARAASQFETHDHHPMAKHHGVSISGRCEKQALESQKSAPELYKHYRTDTDQIDESNKEYTEYKRETLV